MAGNTTDQPRGPAPTGLPNREKLPQGLQSIVDKADKDESFYDELYDGNLPDSTETSIRYAAYASRIRTALLSAQRYVAYTSDIGESFRPVAHPNWVRAAYGVSWAYLIGDVSHEGYKAYCANQRTLHPELPREASQLRYNDAQTDIKAIAADAGVPVNPGVVAPINDYRAVMAQRAVFQSIASMGLPAFTIHSIVRYSTKAMKNVKNPRLRVWGPIGLGLAAVPALPFLFDHPVETAVEWIFFKGFDTFGAAGTAPTTGREKILENKNARPVDKGDKEL